jgi:hypothetical protein
MTTHPDPARNRFIILTAIRFLAAFLVMIGILLVFGRIEWISSDISAPLGYALIVVGIADLLLVVPMLARRWRSDGSRREP